MQCLNVAANDTHALLQKILNHDSLLFQYQEDKEKVIVVTPTLPSRDPSAHCLRFPPVYKPSYQTTTSAAME
jgi:hypothetical protein